MVLLYRILIQRAPKCTGEVPSSVDALTAEHSFQAPSWCILQCNTEHSSPQNQARLQSFSVQCLVMPYSILHDSISNEKWGRLAHNGCCQKETSTTIASLGMPSMILEHGSSPTYVLALVACLPIATTVLFSSCELYSRSLSAESRALEAGVEGRPKPSSFSTRESATRTSSQSREELPPVSIYRRHRRRIYAYKWCALRHNRPLTSKCPLTTHHREWAR